MITFFSPCHELLFPQKTRSYPKHNQKLPQAETWITSNKTMRNKQHKTKQNDNRRRSKHKQEQTNEKNNTNNKEGVYEITTLIINSTMKEKYKKQI